ncbi:MAG TPA: hypothetical protein VHE12_03390 [bacterium]|nr:hypothetical protein [bacterium]
MIDPINPMSWLTFAGGCFGIALTLRHFIIKGAIGKIARLRGAFNEKVKEINKGNKTVTCDSLPKVFTYLYDNERMLTRVESAAKWCWIALLGCSLASFSVCLMALLKWVDLKDFEELKKIGAGIVVPFLLSLAGIIWVAHWDHSNPD